MEGVPQQKSWFRRNIAWVIPVGCLGLVALGCVVFGGVAALFGGNWLKGQVKQVSALQADVRTKARNNPLLVENLGQPIQLGQLKTTGYHNNNGNADVELEGPVSGPKGSGTLYVTGSHGPNGEAFDISGMKLRLEDGKTIDVLERI